MAADAILVPMASSRPLGRSAKVLCSVRSDTTIYRPRVRQSPRRIALRRAVFLAVVLGVLAGAPRARLRGVADASSPPAPRSRASTSAGCPEAQAVRLLSVTRSCAEEHAGHVHRRRAAVRAHRLPARDRAGLARRRGNRCRRGRRLRAAAGLQAPAGAVLRRRRLAAGQVLRRCSPLQARPDRGSGRSQGRRRQGRARGARHPGRRGHDRPPARPQRGRGDRRRRALDVRPRQGRRAAARDHRAQGEERRSRRRRDAGAHRALGADQALLRGDALAGAALADRAAALVALRRQHRPSRSPAAVPRSTSNGSRPRSPASRRTRTSR